MNKTQLFAIAVGMITLASNANAQTWIPWGGFQPQSGWAINGRTVTSEGPVWYGRFNSFRKYNMDKSIAFEKNNLGQTFNAYAYTSAGAITDGYADVFSYSENDGTMYAGVEGPPYFEVRNPSSIFESIPGTSFETPVSYSYPWGNGGILFMGGLYEGGGILKSDGSFAHLHGSWGTGLAWYIGGGYSETDSLFIAAQFGGNKLITLKYGDSVWNENDYPTTPFYVNPENVLVVSKDMIFIAGNNDGTDTLRFFSYNAGKKAWDKMGFVIMNGTSSHVTGFQYSKGTIYIAGGFAGGIAKLKLSNTLPTFTFVALPQAVRGNSDYISGLWVSNDSIWLSTVTTLDGYYIQGGYQTVYYLSESVLSVQLINFTADIKGKGVSLAWQTKEETNADHFEIQRSSNAATFASIGNVKAKGSGSYQYTDAAAPAGKVYYRLKMVDSDGKYEYSSVESVTFQKIEVALFPNPATTSITVQDMPNTEGYIVGMDGKIVQKVHATGTTRVSLLGFKPGTYIISIPSQGVSMKFIKQ